MVVVDSAFLKVIIFSLLCALRWKLHFRRLQSFRTFLWNNQSLYERFRNDAA